MEDNEKNLENLKDEEKFLKILYELYDKEEIITMLKARLVLGEGINIRKILNRMVEIEENIEKYQIICTKKELIDGNLYLDKVEESIVRSFYDNEGVIYLTKDKKQLYFYKNEDNENEGLKGIRVEGMEVKSIQSKAIGVEVEAIESNQTKEIIEIIAVAILKQNLKNKKVIDFFSNVKNLEGKKIEEIYTVEEIIEKLKSDLKYGNGINDRDIIQRDVELAKMIIEIISQYYKDDLIRENNDVVLIDSEDVSLIEYRGNTKNNKFFDENEEFFEEIYSNAEEYYMSLENLEQLLIELAVCILGQNLKEREIIEYFKV